MIPASENLLPQTSFKEGEKESRRWFRYVPEHTCPLYPNGTKDNTHLWYEGAVQFADWWQKGGIVLAAITEAFVCHHFVDFRKHLEISEYI